MRWPNRTSRTRYWDIPECRRRTVPTETCCTSLVFRYYRGSSFVPLAPHNRPVRLVRNRAARKASNSQRVILWS
jgi:hypothetical protein